MLEFIFVWSTAILLMLFMVLLGVETAELDTGLSNRKNRSNLSMLLKLLLFAAFVISTAVTVISETILLIMIILK